VTRYIGQRDHFRCGPIAVLNALKWAGVPVTEKKDLKRISKLCKCVAGRGTPKRATTIALRKSKGIILSKKVKKPTLKVLDEWIDNGGAVLLRYTWKLGPKEKYYKKYKEMYEDLWVGHLAFVSARNKGHYVVHNFSWISEQKVSRALLEKYLSNQPSKNDHAEAYLVRKP
jgi:hypothetical protein